jgi:acyl carrier protein
MAITPSEIAARLREFVRGRQRVAPDDPAFTDGVHLFEAGYLDSLGLVELVAFIEGQFGLRLDETHLFREDFTTIAGIAGIVAAALDARSLAPESETA